MPTDQENKESDEKGNLPESVTKVLEEIKEKLDKPLNQPPPVSSVPPGPTYADRRAALQKSLKFDDEQMNAHEQMILQNQAPVIEGLGWTRLEKKADIETYRKDIEEELKAYPQERRTPELMEKIYLYSKGKHADSRPKEDVKPSPKVESRVSRGPGYDGSTPGTGAGRDDNPPNTNEELDDREKFVAAKLGISEKDYAKSRNAGRAIRELKLPDDRPSNSMADVELKRLQGRR